MPNKIVYQAEKQFDDLKMAEGVILIAQPERFDLGGATYTPDFYSPSEGIYYEVVGTKQAFYCNQMKYMMFLKLYPDKRIRFVKPDGTTFITDVSFLDRGNFTGTFALRIPSTLFGRIHSQAKIQRRSMGFLARKTLEKAYPDGPQAPEPTVPA